MAETSLLVDLRVAQVHRERGIPRYCQSIVLALARERPALEIACLVDRDGDPPLMLEQLAQHCRILDSTKSINAEKRTITHFLQAGLFEKHVAVRTLFPMELGAHRPRLGAIVYDLIPWLFPEAYLATAVGERDYLRVLPAISRLDRVFAISESVRRDVIAITNAEPSRVVTIHGGLDEDRWPALSSGGDAVPEGSSASEITPIRLSSAGKENSSDSLRIVNARGETLELSLPFWLYVGGDDFRKNLPRLIEALALLKREGSLDAALVIACSIAHDRRRDLLVEAAALGLEPGVDIIFTGYVADETLGQLFASCLASVFPSLYEGLGLPVLESYTFGKPVLASDTAALRELVPDRCRFDPYSVPSIADAMRRFRRDPTVAEESLAFAPEVIAVSRWPGAALKLAEWLDAHDRIGRATAAPKPLWVASSLPPDTSGVAFYTQRSLGAPTLGPVTFFAPVQSVTEIEAVRNSLARARHSLQREAAPTEVLSLASLADARLVSTQDPVLFVLGNSHHHLATIAYLSTYGVGPGDAVLLHDVFIRGVLAMHFGTEEQLKAGLLEAYPAEDVARWLATGGNAQGVTGTLLGPRLLVHRTGVRHFIVNSTAAASLLRGDLGEDAAGVRIDVLFLPILESIGPTKPHDPERLRIGHFGILGRAKHPDRLIAACDALAATRRIELVIAGYGVLAYLQRNNLVRKYIEIVESPSDDQLLKVMSSIDCAVQLRYLDQGESSGVVNQLLALRKPVVCTKVGSFEELDGAVRLVSRDVLPADLAATIEEAASAGWPAAGDALVRQRSPRIFETRLRELLGLDSPPKEPRTQGAETIPV